MLRIPAVLTAAFFLLTVGAVGPTFAQSAGGVKVEKASVVVVVKVDCKDKCKPY
jgi:hypothetical protein